MNSEPVAIINSIVSIITAVIAALVTSGILPFTPEEQQQLVGIVVAVGVLIATLVSRSYVTPTGKR